MYGETPLHMAAKNGCSEAARLLLAHGAFIEATANVCFLEWNDTITPGSLVLNQWKIDQLLRHCWRIMLTAVQRTMYCRCSIFSILIHFSLLENTGKLVSLAWINS